MNFMMHKPALFIVQTAIIAIVALVHISALQWYLYWYYPWLDVLTHFLGGLWVALAAVWLLSYAGKRSSLLKIICIVMLIGVGWEVFEVAAGIPREANFMFDSSLDLTMDYIGGICGFILSRYLLRDRMSAE